MRFACVIFKFVRSLPVSKRNRVKLQPCSHCFPEGQRCGSKQEFFDNGLACYSRM